MNLNELEIKKIINDNSFDTHNLGQKLKKYGWEILGRGIDSVVAEHPEKRYALKMFRRSSNYRFFIDLILDNQSNPHLPKISRFIRPVPGTLFYYIRMEKLKIISLNEYRTKYDSELIYLSIIFDKNKISHGFWHLLAPLDDELNSILDANLDKSVDDYDFNSLWNALGKKPDNNWIDIVNKMVDQYKDMISNHISVSFDLGTNNFMQRNNTIVIIDPYF